MNYRKEAQKLIDLVINVDRHIIDIGTPEGHRVRNELARALASMYSTGYDAGVLGATSPVRVDISESESEAPESDVLLVDDLIRRVRQGDPHMITRQYVINRLQERSAPAAEPSNELAMWRLIGEVLIDGGTPEAAHDLATATARVLLTGSKL